MSKGLVLITGVNGYIAAVAAKHFLDHGYSVRGTVRKVASVKEIAEGPLKKYADAGTFTVVEVPDITVDGAFDEAVKGIRVDTLISKHIMGMSLTASNRRHGHSPSRLSRLLRLQRPRPNPTRRDTRHQDHIEQRASLRRPTAQNRSRHVFHRQREEHATPSLHLHRKGLERLGRENLRRARVRNSRTSHLLRE